MVEGSSAVNESALIGERYRQTRRRAFRFRRQPPTSPASLMRSRHSWREHTHSQIIQRVSDSTCCQSAGCENRRQSIRHFCSRCNPARLNNPCRMDGCRPGHRFRAFPGKSRRNRDRRSGKTDTISAGKPKVTDIIPAEGMNDRELLTLAFALEQISEHPLAKAILHKAGMGQN